MEIFASEPQDIEVVGKKNAAKVNVLRVPPKSLRSHPYVIESRGITMAPLFLRLTS